jgi:hypothetical protein
VIRKKSELELFSRVNHGAFDPSGKWINELDSTMNVTRFKNGLFSGTYSSSVSSSESPVEGSLTGMVAGDTIGFVVSWSPTFESTTSWSGKILSTPQGEQYIYTLWHLSRGVAEPKDWWESFLSGSDTFWRIT